MNREERPIPYELTVRILHQGKALVRALEALGTIDPSGPIERPAVSCSARR